MLLGHGRILFTGLADICTIPNYRRLQAALSQSVTPMALRASELHVLLSSSSFVPPHFLECLTTWPKSIRELVYERIEGNRLVDVKVATNH